MSEDRYGFCKTFVKGADTQTVMALLAELLGGEFQRRSMMFRGLVIDVLRNTDTADPEDAGDDFVRWPTLVELESNGAAGDVVVDTMTNILTALWDSGLPAVAACDFEDELPWSGGIQRIQA